MIKIETSNKINNFNPLSVCINKMSILTGVNGCGKSQFLKLIENNSSNIIYKFNNVTNNYENFSNVNIVRIEFDQYRPTKPSNATVANLAGLTASIHNEIQSSTYRRNNNTLFFLEQLRSNLGKNSIEEITYDEVFENIAYYKTNINNTIVNDFSTIFLNYKRKLDENNRKKGAGIVADFVNTRINLF